MNAARAILSRASEYGWSDDQRLAVQSIVELQSETEPVPRSAEVIEALEIAVATERRRADVTGALVARGLALQLQLSALERESDAGAFRDRAMATMVEEASTMISTLPVIVWAHNAHVATDGLEPYPPMGSYLRESLGAG